MKQAMKDTVALLATLLACQPALIAADAPTGKRPNILHIHADDYRSDGLNALGNPILKDPNLDQVKRLTALLEQEQAKWGDSTPLTSAKPKPEAWTPPAKPAKTRADFVHPGIAHSAESIAFVRSKLEAKQQPWMEAWEELKSSPEAALSWKSKPRAYVERGPYNNPNIGSSQFSNDATAAYIHALWWALAGEKAHAEKAAEIVDAWSGTLKSISNHDARLLVGMSGYKFCIAAELLKHTWDGWPAGRQERFAAMLRDIWYPIIKDFYPSANGNWDAAMMQTMIAMGVFLDDQAMFNRARSYFLTGEGNGAIGNYFKASGQCQESGRDQAHTQMGLEFLANTCETAWIQGIDLYAALDSRLLKGFEYTATYNLGIEVPYEPYRSFEGRYHYKAISDNGRGRLRPMYERVFNHYHNRRGLAAPLTERAALKLRSEGRGPSSSALDTLMFASQPARFEAAMPRPARQSVEGMPGTTVPPNK